ncbi:katanin p80 WD40 repeat-containing subunit B1 homolog [Selaginella moellendorffii]|uniref:katanin p80 WD40 repeat-containing subunit B1 homolog n=1 Tax=Selaginella moellendorffii TaxID=88036 RepID=UPI000D1CCCD6|nr:katanin p80 WD40 repeat-containing subunit B1 homolog [Selaginella moellendorffii]|eukprot:XP_024522849.1 katanin p80 WD40 repeat-containing subunit B1 homolog [Selaginella moellendorffii]
MSRMGVEHWTGVCCGKSCLEWESSTRLVFVVQVNGIRARDGSLLWQVSNELKRHWRREREEVGQSSAIVGDNPIPRVFPELLVDLVGGNPEEFVAHSSQVNCLKIGRKTSRVLVTGGDDHKVNMWAIGKPNAILSLAGHSSPVESVTFDAAESHVVAGAASGAIKLWDLEEAKIVRTLTGHRSNCTAVDFHPFGEFFASGSLDSNLKIWDIRRKGCIHTYRGHCRGVNCLKFSPDGRWVVSGGEDKTVKLWDLTAGKLIHDFKYHDDQILSLDFHPHEFLLATGSDDKTAKFYDLETFELVGSSGPEDSGVRSMIFTPDGRTLLCALREGLKVYSWEPLRCHDVIDANWSRLADLNVHEGKLLGCSFNQSCVGVWVVDLPRVAPFRSISTPRNLRSPTNTNGEHVSFQKVKTPSPGRDQPTIATPQRRGSAPELQPSRPNTSLGTERTSIKLSSLRKSSGELLKRNNDREAECTTLVSPKTPLADKLEQKNHPESHGDKTGRGDDDGGMFTTRRRLRKLEEDFLLGQALAEADSPRNLTSFGASTTGNGRPWSSSAYWERREKERERTAGPDARNGGKFYVELDSKRSRSSCQEDTRVIEEILQERTTMSNTMQSRLAKLQVVRRFWMKKDLKSAVETMAKMGDKSVLVDGLSVLIERSDVFTLEIAAMLLPLLTGLLASATQRHVMISIAFTSMLVTNFGHVISDAVSTSPTLGVDLQAEKRFGRCDACFKELQLLKQGLKPFLRKSGELGKAALDLNLALDRMDM